MGKIKLNLPTGVSVDKSLINCFKTDGVIYAIFDAASVGSMGLPIILVSKYENERLVKIVDADEWTKVKGQLKEIISGIKKEFVKIENVVNADEIFYTQLTLPVASFDALKKVYEEAMAENVSQNMDEVKLDNIPAQMQDITSSGNVSLPGDSTTSQVVNNELPNMPSVIQSELSVPNNNNIQGEISSLNEIGNTQENELVLPMVNNENPASPSLNEGSDSLVVPSQSSNVISDTVQSSPVNSDAVANPLLNDNALPVLELPKTDVSDEVSQVNIKNIEQPESAILNNSVSTIGNSEEKTNDYSVEKEEFLKFCGEFFDKMIEKIKNN